MATKRMFDRAIIDTDKFMDLSLTAKAIYFLLGMEADDEGFVSYKKVMRVHGGNDDDVKVLVVKGFLIHFESGVVVVTDWNRNNWLDSRRIRPTEYQKEKKSLIQKDGIYVLLSNGLASIEESSIEENRIETIAPSPARKGKAKVGYSPLGAEILKAFEEVDSKNKNYYGNKTQRRACDFLLEEYGLETTLKAIKILPAVNRKKLYIGQVTTPYELQEKWGKIKNALEQEKITKSANVAFV